MLKGKIHRGGFALPTVLISSVVMMIILAVSVSSVVAVRTSLRTQYYEQLAKIAGESGVAYAKACLAKNGNVPQWTNGQPLQPDTDCTGTSNLAPNACPTDPACSVVSTSAYRSSFKVPRPTVDSNGKALTIANNGYVDLLRSTTGETWRTYRQPAVQVAAVPDLCSGAASSELGWQNATVTTDQDSISGVSSAQSISISDGNVPAGRLFFRKDFTVTTAGTYSLSGLTASTSNLARIYIDGTVYVSTNGSTITNTAVNLSVGCHTISAEMANKTLTPQDARLTVALRKSGLAPILVSNGSWRVSAGSSVHFSQPDFYADSSVWTKVGEYTSYVAQNANSNWFGVGDIFTQMISPAGNGCALTCPANSSSYLRDSKDFYVSSPTDVRVAALCDDDCTVYIDGQVVISTAPWSSIAQQTLTLTPGAHHIAIRLYNGNTAANPSGAAATVVARDTGQVLTRTDRSWIGATTWTAGLNSTTNDIRSYEDSYYPSPDEIARPTTLDALVVAGGGGGGYNSGGGGGGGGVINAQGIQLGVGTYTVTIGAGGAGAASSVVGTKGGNTVFGSYTAIGGGGGSSRDAGTAATSGGSGGGGAGSPDASRITGAAGTSGQGFAGGDATTAPPDPGVAAKGGGGGGAGGQGVNGSTTTAGHGAAGFISYITGSVQSFSGGGGGGVTASNGQNGVATDGATGGVNSAPAATGAANRGGGGGGNGGTGGSGVVFIRIKTGSMSITTTGTVTVTTATIDSIGYTIYKFTGNGTFKINSIN